MDDPSLEKQKVDFADLQAELAGLQTGKMSRFLTGERSRRPGEGGKEERDRQRAAQTALELLLLDPVYRETYQRVSTLLDDVQTRLDRAMLRTTEAIERLETLTADLRDNAAKLGDGTAVFRAADGSVWTADGRRLSEAESASLSIPLETPSWEQYKGAEDALGKARVKQKRLAEIQTETLDPAREKLNDPENPPSMEELKDIEDNIKQAVVDIDNVEKATPTFNASADPVVKEQATALNFELEIPAP